METALRQRIREELEHLPLWQLVMVHLYLELSALSNGDAVLWLLKACPPPQLNE